MARELLDTVKIYNPFQPDLKKPTPRRCCVNSPYSAPKGASLDEPHWPLPYYGILEGRTLGAYCHGQWSGDGFLRPPMPRAILACSPLRTPLWLRQHLRDDDVYLATERFKLKLISYECRVEGTSSSSWIALRFSHTCVSGQSSVLKLATRNMKLSRPGRVALYNLPQKYSLVANSVKSEIIFEPDIEIV